MNARRIAILGFARSVTETPFHDPTVDVWGMNELYFTSIWGTNNARAPIPRWDAWFEMHEAQYLGRTARIETPTEPDRHLAWLREQPPGKPIYMLRHEDAFPASVAYPVEAMVARFGRYFTSTVGYMLALAIAQIVDQRAQPAAPEPGEWIGLFGVDLASDNEHAAQRPNTEYFIGWARGLGIEVYVPPQGAVTRAAVGLYGYEPAPEHTGLVSEWFLRKHRAEYQEKYTNACAKLNTLDGVLQGWSFLFTHGFGTDSDLQLTDRQRAALKALLDAKTLEHGQAMADMNTIHGVVQASTFYLQICEFKKRGVYVPETDPFAAPTAGTSGT